jgi:NTP pyrophosphatase (non-canonical NTP hydrolase)
MADSIEDLLPSLLEFRAQREWEQFHLPKELAAAISIEASELQELFLWKERESHDKVKQDQHRMELIRDEVADVLIYLLFLSHDLDIDLPDAIKQKIEKNKTKYPAEEYRGRFREPSTTPELYLSR